MEPKLSDAIIDLVHQMVDCARVDDWQKFEKVKDRVDAIVSAKKD